MTRPDAPVLDDTALAVIDAIPSPVSIFDRTSLRILAANAATAQELGFGIEDLLGMTITELRPPADIAALKAAVATIAAPLTDAGRWRLRRADGGLFEVGARWRPVTFRGRDAVLTTWHDITALRKDAQSDVSVSRERDVTPDSAQASARLYRALFESAPGGLLVLTPERHEIVAASDAFLAATRTQMDEIVGRPLFEVFPDDPADPHADGVRNMRASLEQVERSHHPDVMAVQRHPIRLPAAEGGGFEERFWSQVNAPVLDPAGQLVYIIHRAVDVTELERTGSNVALDRLGDNQRDFARDVLLQSRELGKAHAKLEQQAAHLRTAERLADLSTWSFDIEAGTLQWSQHVHEIYGIPTDQSIPDFVEYVGLVHPDDREEMLATYRAFEETGAPQIAFRHRIVRPDGRIVHIKGVGERHRVNGRDQVVGFVQDVTRHVTARERLAQATRLMKTAGDKARLGGWLVDLETDKVHWTDEVAAIHGEPAGTQPKFDAAVAYYTPEARPVIESRFVACASEGVEFDEILTLETAQGNRIWVRAMGEPVRDANGAIVAVQGALQDVTEMMEARRRIVEVTRQLRETLESMGDAFMMIDNNWRFMFVNKQAEILLDRRREDLLGSNLWDAFPDAQGTSFQREYERARSERQTVRFTEFYPPLGKWFEVNAYPAPDGIAVYFNDITEKRARNQQLRLLETAVAQLNDIVLITEADPIDAPDGPRVVYVNDAVRRNTGFGPEEVLGRTPRLFQGPATDRAELDRIRAMLEKGQPVRSELVNHTRDGTPFHLEIDIVPLADANGALTHFVSVQRDVTERKRAEEALRIRDERFQLVSQATNDVVWDWDVATGRIWWNDALFTLFGHDPAILEPDLAAWANLLHPDDRDSAVQSLHEVIAGTDRHWTREYRFMHADGQPRQVIDRGFVIRDEAGTAVRMLGSMIDVTDQRGLEARYQQAQKLEAVGQLTGGVAHDFNNLLTVILGNAEILAEDLADPEQRALAEQMVMAAERGAEFTSRLLAFSRRQALAPERLDLNRQIAEIQTLLRRALRDDIELEVLAAPDLWSAVADPAQLESALLNLVLNARDAMPDGGHLTIETANVAIDGDDSPHAADLFPGDYVMIAVADSGQGMPRETVDRAFEPFFTTKDVGSGSGLGLSMVYGFAKQSGGHVTIYSEPDEGTTVRLYLPRSDGDAAIEEHAPPTDAVRGGTERILVVEDDAAVRGRLVAQLRDLGYRVESAETGPEALGKLRQKAARFDLILTDIFMPGGMTGRELADTALAERPGLRILFTSGYSENALVRHGRMEPGVQLLAKPYRRKELAEKLRSVLDAPENS